MFDSGLTYPDGALNPATAEGPQPTSEPPIRVIAGPDLTPLHTCPIGSVEVPQKEPLVAKLTLATTLLWASRFASGFVNLGDDGSSFDVIFDGRPSPRNAVSELTRLDISPASHSAFMMHLVHQNTIWHTF